MWGMAVIFVYLMRRVNCPDSGIRVEQVPWASGKFLDQWCTLAMKSKIEPMKKIAKSFRCKRELILNWFRAGGTLSSGSVEGFNNKVKLVTRKSYGLKKQEAYEIALYHNLGELPQL